jgi:hypothetical protein
MQRVKVSLFRYFCKYPGFEICLPAEDRKTFTKMLSDCYAKAINVKAQPFSSEPLIMRKGTLSYIVPILNK